MLHWKYLANVCFSEEETLKQSISSNRNRLIPFKCFRFPLYLLSHWLSIFFFEIHCVIHCLPLVLLNCNSRSRAIFDENRTELHGIETAARKGL